MPSSVRLGIRGLGVAVLPVPLIASELKAGTLVKVIEGSKPATSGLDLAWKRKQTPKIILTKYRDALLRIAAEHRDGGGVATAGK